MHVEGEIIMRQSVEGYIQLVETACSSIPTLEVLQYTQAFSFTVIFAMGSLGLAFGKAYSKLRASGSLNITVVKYYVLIVPTFSVRSLRRMCLNILPAKRLRLESININ